MPAHPCAIAKKRYNTHMKKLSLFAVLLVLALAGAYFAFPEKADDAFVVRANDGAAELRIPKDTVLVGGAVGDITMTAIAPADVIKESNQPIDLVKVYRLEPDGLTFSKPATISVTFPYDPNRAYSPVFLIDPDEEGKIEGLNITDFQLDEKQKTLTVSGELPHFSNFLAKADAMIFDARNIPDGEITVAVGQSFDHTYAITPGGKWEFRGYWDESDPNVAQASGRHTMLEIANGTRWEVNPDFRSPHRIRTFERVEPQEIILKKTDLAATEEYRVTNRFTCAKAGYDAPLAGSLFYYTLQTTMTVFEGEKQVRKPWIGRERRNYSWAIPKKRLEINCVVPPSGQDSTSADATPSSPTAPATTAPTTTSGGKIKVCGLPGGEPCPKR